MTRAHLGVIQLWRAASVSRLVVTLTLTVAFLAAPLAAQAQPAGERPRIGALSVFGEPHPTVEAFRQALRDLGYVEGSNLAVDIRYAQGRTDQYPRLIADTIKGQPDLIVVWGTELAQAVRRATTTIPIVLAVVDRPVEMGLVATLARPGGNVTGLTTLNVAPTLKELAVATRALGIQVRPLQVRGPEDFERPSTRSSESGPTGSSTCRTPPSPRIFSGWATLP
jgi:putative ABC transport system substrate-binding protein